MDIIYEDLVTINSSFVYIHRTVRIQNSGAVKFMLSLKFYFGFNIKSEPATPADFRPLSRPLRTLRLEKNSFNPEEELPSKNEKTNQLSRELGLKTFIIVNHFISDLNKLSVRKACSGLS